jgi:beta-ureidopropionase / N-carbamoyl-L-amino-acid hydrolase
VITLEQLNALAPGEFATTLGGVFEHSPWVAQRAAGARPFTSRLQLLDSMRAAVAEAAPAQQLALIRAHPQLGVRARAASPLTLASAAEQRRAGLASCTPADGVCLQQLNARYLERFGFPFILAVRGHDPASIIANFERRLDNDVESERLTALNQIGAIAAYRLADMIASPPGPEIIAMLERLLHSCTPAAAQTVAARALVREWMQAAGLEVWPAPGSEQAGNQLLGHAAGQSSAKTLLTGVYRDTRLNALRHQGAADFITAIEVAQQLRHRGARPPFDLAVLARPDDARLGDVGISFDGDAPQGWVELRAADVAGATAAVDAQGMEIAEALRMAPLSPAAVTLVQQGTAAGGHGTLSAFNAAGATRAERSLEESLGHVQSAA